MMRLGLPVTPGEKLRAIVAASAEGITVLDRDLKILWANHLVESWAGRLKGLKGIECHRIFGREEGVCGGCPAAMAFETGKTEKATVVYRLRDCERRIELTASPMFNRSGKVVAVAALARDTSEKEDWLLHCERLAGAGEFAVGIAHEIRNPLGNINASAQFCLNKYEVGHRIRKHLRAILRNSESANRVVKDLLDFARPDEIRLKPGCVGKVIKKACALVRSRSSKQRVRVFRRWPKNLPPVMLDENRLEWAFLNFIINALDAMPRGGSLVVAAYLDIRTGEVVASFSDTGEGIPQENLKRIFDPFFTTKKDGVGLGLFMAHHIIVCHRGSIQIKSEVGRGTEAIVRIPVAEESDGRR
jgi:signal transduction histidine kinase